MSGPSPRKEANLKYPNVKNAHIVPRTYLENWAVDGKIGVVVVANGKRLVLGVENVGTRRRFYRRERPDGTPIDDIEWSLGEGERAITPVLRSIGDEWPLPIEKKGMLAEIMAYQLLRGTRWKDEYEERTRAAFDEYRNDPDNGYTVEQLHQLEAELATDSTRLLRMITSAPTITSILGSMQWTLLDFHTPIVATSDHPVVLWPGGDARPPQPTRITQAGLLECIEIRLPLSPRHALLMTWADVPDARAAAHRSDAKNLNAFTLAEADEQWFHHPERLPPLAAGKLLPLSPAHVPGYTPEAAAAAQRRQRTHDHAQSKIGRDLGDREIEFQVVK